MKEIPNFVQKVSMIDGTSLDDDAIDEIFLKNQKDDEDMVAEEPMTTSSEKSKTPQMTVN